MLEAKLTKKLAKERFAVLSREEKLKFLARFAHYLPLRAQTARNIEKLQAINQVQHYVTGRLLGLMRGEVDDRLDTGMWDLVFLASTRIASYISTAYNMACDKPKPVRVLRFPSAPELRT
jgi:hypothetical protein